MRITGLTPPVGMRVNPAVHSRAERFVDGAITAQVMADAAAREGLPLFIDVKSGLDAEGLRRAHDSMLLHFATDTVSKAQREFANRRRQLGFANRAPAARRAGSKSAEMRFLNKARAALRAALRGLASAEAVMAAHTAPAAPTPAPALRLAA